MAKNRNIKLMMYANIAIVLMLLAYKGYLGVYETDFTSLNIKNIKAIEKQAQDNEDITFAVMGNIKNSIEIFDKRIVGKINSDSELDFMVATGNSVLDGSEDKYRLLYRSLKKIGIPSVLALGQREASDKGYDRFYRHFGPYYFSFAKGDSYFIFLDTTGRTSSEWQNDWLTSELEESAGYRYRFVFMNKPLYSASAGLPEEMGEGYIKDRELVDFLQKSFERYGVTAVFASSQQVYDSRQIGGVRYFITGGAGGWLHIEDKSSFYHYVKVKAGPAGVEYTVVKQDMPSSHAAYQVFENAWVYIHSLFYSNIVDILMAICSLAAVAILIYIKASVPRRYYRDFSGKEEDVEEGQRLRIAFFTNNYLPFIGGVPISIFRLAKGLRKLGHRVHIFAPEYPLGNDSDDEDITRFRSITTYEKEGLSFPIVNIFTGDIEKSFAADEYDVVHIHHPMWLGSRGLGLAEKYSLPAVLTYHTRLEEYSHFLPLFRIIFKNIISHRMIKRFAQRCDAIIAPTNTAKEYLENIGVSRRIAVLPTGVDFEGYENVDEGELAAIRERHGAGGHVLLCSVMRLSVEKNVYFLLDGLEYAKKSGKVMFKCVIIGDGPERENIRRVIRENGLEDTVMLTGMIPPGEVCKYYMASDIFVFSSQSETQGMVVLEAMAGGCPVVAIRSSGIDDVVKDGFNGYKTGADIEEWGNRLVELVENAELRSKMAGNASDFARKFSIEAMAQRAVKVYTRAIKDRRDFNIH